MAVSVLASVYYKEKAEYLRQCLESLTRQTMQDFEVVLVEDGPLTDDLHSVIQRYATKLNLVSVRLKENVGLARALNAGLDRCSYDLVARMDTDDVAMPCRLQEQLTFMRTHSDVSVCSAWIEERDESMDRVLFLKEVPVSHEDIARYARWRNPINHPVAVLRKSAVLAVGGYPAIFPEDYALWSLMICNGYTFANIPKVLLHMRTGNQFIERRGRSFLRGELELLRFQKKIGFLNSSQYMRNVVIRSAVRLPPSIIRRHLYRVAR